MVLEFADQRLALIETPWAFETALPFTVIRSARARLAIIRAAPTFTTLKKWRSFGLSPEATCPGVHRLRIVDRWAMQVAFADGDPEQSTVQMIVQNNEGDSADGLPS